MLSPELKKLSTRITPTRSPRIISWVQLTQLVFFLWTHCTGRAATHFARSAGYFTDSRGTTTLRNSWVFIRGLQRKCGLMAPAHPNLLPSLLVHPPSYSHLTPSCPLPGCFLSQPSMLDSSSSLSPGFTSNFYFLARASAHFFSPWCKCTIGQGYSSFSHETLRCPHGCYCTAIPQLSWLPSFVQFTLFTFLPLLPDLEIFKQHTHLNASNEPRTVLWPWMAVLCPTPRS